jgi:glycosyltransferase A (GT-A) superfamily protein (DUF2064 family)
MNTDDIICIPAKNPEPGKAKDLLERCLDQKQAAMLVRAPLHNTISATLQVSRANALIASWPRDSEKETYDFFNSEMKKRIRESRRVTDIRLILRKGKEIGEGLNNISRYLCRRGAQPLIFVCHINPLIGPVILRASFDLLKSY